MDTAKDTDYMTMSYEQRAFDTDLLKAPEGHVVTGVKFRNLGGHINLEVQVTPIKFTDGKLIPDRSTWIGNDNTPATAEPRRQKLIQFPDVPTKYVGNEIDSRHNQFILFDSTDDHKDIMQTTIPFIDAQPVTTTTGSWLSGVGLYHKGKIGYGGYVGAMIKTFDFSRHLLPDMKKRSGKEMKEALKYDFEQLN